MTEAAPPESKLIATTPKPGVRLLTIDRPSRRNALDVETYQKLLDAVVAADRDDSVRAIVVTGAGGHFCAGNDIADFQNERSPGARAAVDFLHALNNCETALIGAVEGNAVGIGVTMLLHFDFAYAAQGAKLRMPFVPLGICPEGASTYILPRLAGTKRAMQLLLLGELFDAATAIEAGIATAAVEDGTALDHALATAEKIAALPRGSVSATKELIKRGERRLIDETIDAEAERFLALARTPEAQAIFAAFFANKGK